MSRDEIFQLTRLMRGVTNQSESDSKCRQFQLTRLMRGVTGMNLFAMNAEVLFQLTRLMRGVTANAMLLPMLVGISTHTPHARRDG